VSYPLNSVVGMFERALDTAEARLNEVLGKLEPEVLDSRDAKALLERSTRLERKCAAIKALAARKSAKATLKLTVPAAVAAGRYSVLACADSRAKVKESKEKNNCRSTA